MSAKRRKKRNKPRKRPAAQRPTAQPLTPQPAVAGGPRWAGPAAVALVGLVAAMSTIVPGESGPGVTCDEAYHVSCGKGLVLAWRQQGLAFFRPENIRRNFPWQPDGPPVHPPLGNWALGWTHHLFDPAPDVPEVISIVGARFAPAVAFGLLVLVVGLGVTKLEGPAAGTVAAAAVVLVPRMFGHAHLAALDTFTALTLTAAVFAVVEADARGGRWWHFALAGVVWGLALLTRLHGVLLVVPVVVWLVWRRRLRAAVPVASWTAAGGATMFALWPWLWLDAIEHLRQYLGTATDRVAIHVFYVGRVWADRDVPWHYPVIMFLVTLPLGLLALGGLGLWAKRRREDTHPGFWLALGTLAFMLLVFAWPGTPVYDGVRLFLVAFPLWAVAVGAGAKWAAEHRLWGGVAVRTRWIALGLFLALQGVGLVVYRNCPLSHYSLLVGGLAGGEKLGFEVTYWGDALEEPMLAEAAARARGGVVVFGPNLAPFQSEGVRVSSPSLLEDEVRLIGWEKGWKRPPPGCRLGIFYRRQADLEAIPTEVLDAKVVREHGNQGVWLVRLVEFSASAE